MFRRSVRLASCCAVTLLSSAAGGGIPATDALRFELLLSTRASDAVAALGLQVPITGRVFVIVTRDTGSEPREQMRLKGPPFWGMDVNGVRGGDSVLLETAGATAPAAPSSTGVRGYPFARLDEIPPGEYTVQAFLNVYTRFERADGQTLNLHLNSGAGQRAFRAPGNVYSRPRQVRLGPEGGTVRLSLDQVIAPLDPVPAGGSLQQGNPADRGDVRFVKIRSALLSGFWGRDMYLGANVLLPHDYEDKPEARYPTLYMQGHFPGRRAPFGYGDSRAGELTAYWRSREAAPLVAISIRDANPYYDTSYSVDSANVGPYGAAITTELIPHLEREFRLIPESWARLTAGGSTGGWEALAMQIFYPDTFGGAWGWCPDPVDFNYYQIVGVYEDDNAYTTGNDWHRVERPNTRSTDGNVTSTVRQENYMELVRGPDSRSGGQWAIWEAVFGPVGTNGYPAPIWDPLTGVIDPQVAEHWRDNYDLHRHLRANWARVGPALRGKLHIAVGDMDTYYLEQAVYLLQDFLDRAEPPADATFQYGRREPHCWIGYSPDGSGAELSNVEFVRQAESYLRSHTRRATRGWPPR